MGFWNRSTHRTRQKEIYSAQLSGNSTFRELAANSSNCSKATRPNATARLRFKSLEASVFNPRNSFYVKYNEVLCRRCP